MPGCPLLSRGPILRSRSLLRLWEPVTLHPAAPRPSAPWFLSLGGVLFFLTRGALCSPCPGRALFPAPAAAVLRWWISLPFRCDLRTSEQALCQFCDLLPASKWRQEGIHFHQGDDSASVFLTIWREAPPAQKQSAEELRERIGRENKSRSK